MLVIVDYGMGNIRSVIKAFQRLNVDVIASADPSEILKADKLILPGVGHFSKGMENLHERKLIEPLRQAVEEMKIPLMGICLGMQLLTRKSEEGDVEGLGFFPLNTVQFAVLNEFKIPHMGWNTIEPLKSMPLFDGIDENDRFYFAHSYHIQKDAESDYVAGMTDYGYTFPSVINKGNLIGVQFHPEKSHDSGLKLLENFIQHY